MSQPSRRKKVPQQAKESETVQTLTVWNPKRILSNSFMMYTQRTQGSSLQSPWSLWVPKSPSWLILWVLILECCWPLWFLSPGQDSPTRSLISFESPRVPVDRFCGWWSWGVTDPSDPSPWAGLPILHLMFGWGAHHLLLSVAGQSLSCFFNEDFARCWSQNTYQAGQTVGFMPGLVVILEAWPGYRRWTSPTPCAPLLRLLSQIPWSFLVSMRYVSILSPKCSLIPVVSSSIFSLPWPDPSCSQPHLPPVHCKINSFQGDPRVPPTHNHLNLSCYLASLGLRTVVWLVAQWLSFTLQWIFT